MNDVIPNVRMEGEIIVDDQNIISPEIDVVALRRNVGMVFQQPNPFPKSIFDNIAYGLRINGLTNSAAERETRVEEALRQAAIWDEVKDRLHKNALSMSGGEQQRLCIARALAVRPEILLMDEPASALDPISTAKIEDLIFRLKEGLYDCDRDPQHAAGCEGQRLHGLFPPGGTGGNGAHGRDFYQSARQAHRGLHHGTIRVALGISVTVTITPKFLEGC